MTDSTPSQPPTVLLAGGLDALPGAVASALAAAGIEVGAYAADAPAPENAVLVAPYDGEASAEGIAELVSSRGCAVLAWVREASEAAFLAALATGAHDAIAAGADPSEVVARVRHAPSRRVQAETAALHAEKLRLTREQIEAIAMVDMDTGLFNRRYLLARLRESLASSRRYGRSLSLVVFAIRNRDEILSEHGEHAFALVVEEVADLLAVGLRNADLEARVGDAWFALMLPETDLAGAQVVTERLTQDLAEREFEGDVHVEIGAGIADAAADLESAQAMLRAAISRATGES